MASTVGRNSADEGLMMPCEPWQSAHAGASVEPSPMTRSPWNDLSYISNSLA